MKYFLLMLKAQLDLVMLDLPRLEGLMKKIIIHQYL